MENTNPERACQAVWGSPHAAVPVEIDDYFVAKFD